MIGSKNLNEISGIGNESYFISHYHEYLSNNGHSRLIMIDLDSFKSINDTFGHNMGDEYLVYFSKLLLKVFKDSLVVRLHGDEFTIVTTKNEREISELFDKCNELIKKSVDNKELPREFSFSAGSSEAEDDINEASNKADYMMYYAKKNRMMYQPFKIELWNSKGDFDSFSTELDRKIQKSLLTHYSKQLYDSNKQVVNIKRIYTRDENGEHLFNESKYDNLRNINKLAEFDLYNVYKLLNEKYKSKDKMVILVDYTTVASSLKFVDFLASGKYDPSNFIIAIDLKNINFKNINLLIDNINKIKSSGFEVLLDKVDMNLPMSIWNNTNPEYVSISSEFWCEAMKDDRVRFLLENTVNLYSGYKNTSTLLFGNVESEEEFKFLKSINPKNTLYYGNYFETDKLIEFKK